MNWLSRKLLQGTLAKFFKNVNDKDIEVSMLSQQSLKLRNLELRTDILKSDSSPVVLSECRVGLLQLSFDPSKLLGEPVGVRISDVLVVLKLNESYLPKKPAYSREFLEEYKKHVFSKAGTAESYKSSELGSFGLWLVDFAHKKINLLVSRVTVAFECRKQAPMHYFGVSIQEIVITSRTVVAVNRQDRTAQMQVELQGVGAFTGVATLVNTVQRIGVNRQIKRLDNEIRRLYFMRELGLRLNVVIEQKRFDLTIGNLVVSITPYVLKQISDLVNYLEPVLNPVPQLRPGMGQRLSDHPKAREGCKWWWCHIVDQLTKRIDQHREYNMVSNPFFRRYVFCLMYSIVSEPTEEMKYHMQKFESGKKQLDILNIHQFIFERVARIQSTPEDSDKQIAERVFVNFICKSARTLKNQNIERIQYIDFRTLKKAIYPHNGRDYIHRVEMQSLSQFLVRIEMRSAHIFLSEFGLVQEFQRLASQQLEFKKQYDLLQADKDSFGEYVQKIYWKFIRKVLDDLGREIQNPHIPAQWRPEHFRKLQGCFGELQIQNVDIQMHTSQRLDVSIQKMLLLDLSKVCYSPKVLQVRDVQVKKTEISKQNKTFVVQRSCLDVTVDYVCVNMLKPFFEKVVFISSVAVFSVQKALEQVVVVELTLGEILHNTLFKSKYLKAALRTQTSVRVNKINVLLPMDYSKSNDILVAQILGPQFEMVGSDLRVLAQSTKVLFVNSYEWVEKDNIFKRVIQEKEHPNDPLIFESIILNLGPMEISKKNQLRQGNASRESYLQNIRRRKKAPNDYINTLVFSIPLIVIRLSIKELFQLNYLIALWMQTFFTPQQFFKKRHITRYREDHNKISQEELHLLELMTEQTQIQINAIALSMATVKLRSSDQDTGESEDLFELFLNEIIITSKTFSISSELSVTVDSISLLNLHGHIPINRLVMLRFVESMLRNSDFYQTSSRKEGLSLEELIGEGVSVIQGDRTPKVNLPGTGSRNFNLEQPIQSEDLLRGIDFQETERSKLFRRLLLYNNSPNRVPFISLRKSTKYLLSSRVENKTDIKLSRLCFLMDPDFFKNCVLMYECAKDFRLRRNDHYLQFVKAKGYIASIQRPVDLERRFMGCTSEEQQLLRQHNVIVDVMEPTINGFSLSIEQVNFMIYHKESVVYSILIQQFTLQMQQLYLLDQIKIAAKKVVLVDTHPHAGEWPEMLRVGFTKEQQEKMSATKLSQQPPSFELLLFLYKNPILIRKNMCKTEMRISMRNSRVTYLNKKVMELVNCIMFIVGKLMAVKKKFRGASPVAQNKAERFLYSISIEQLKVFLPQNSLSQQHFYGTIERGWVGNSSHFLLEAPNAQKTTSFVNQSNSFDFQPCDRQDSDLVEFQSFVENDEQADLVLEDKVIVQLTNLLIHPKKMGLSGVYLINAPNCKVEINLGTPNFTFVSVQTDKPLSLSLSELEFQLLMRIFTQNFIEKTLVFDDDELRKEQIMNRRIDEEFRKELNSTNVLQEQEINQPPPEELRVTTQVYITVVETSINTYGSEYNLSLITHAITVGIKLFNDSSKDIDLLIETVQFYNNLTNKMFINSYDDERDNAMGDLIYQPPPNQVFQASSRFTKEEKQKYVRRVSERYKFKPRHKEDLDVHNQTATTKMEGWSQQDIVQSEGKLHKLKHCLHRVFCSCCAKPQSDKLRESQVAELIDDAIHEGSSLLNDARHNEEQDIVIDTRDAEQPDQLNRSYITSEEEIIQRRYFGRQLSERVRVSSTKGTFLTMMIHMRNTGQKNIQLEMTNLNMAVSQHREIIYLVNYMVKGFEAEKNSKIKKHLRYNNFPPFYLGLKMTNSKAIIGKSLDENHKSYLQSIQDVVISQQRIGDTTQGPGSSKLKVQVKVVLNYCRYSRKLQPIQLSRPINIIAIQSSVVPLQVNTASKHSGLKEVIIFGEASKKVQISIPLTYTNDIIKIITPLFPNTKPPEGTDVVFEKQQTPEQILGFLLKMITDNMKVLVPGIIIELMSGKKKTLLKLEVEDVYMDVISVENPSQSYGKLRAYMTLMAHYVNMKSETFEPALEPFMLCVKVKSTKLNGVLHERIRIGSISGSTEFQNSLNLNLSLGLIRNLKEAWTRFNGNYQAESDLFLDLSIVGWNKQLTERQQDELLNKYRLKRQYIGTFFGKRFIHVKSIQETDATHERYWNIKLQQYLVLHSFFDYDKGRKVIHIRTPYRLINQTGKQLTTAFRKNRTAPYEWRQTIKPGMCYSIPKDIYVEDILMTLSFEQGFMPHNAGTSLLYLLSQYEERAHFNETKVGKALANRAFRLSTDNPKRYIRKSDFVLKSDQETVLGVCVKSSRPMREKKKSSGLANDRTDNTARTQIVDHEYEEQVHETSILLLPPLVIKNELPMYLELYVDEQQHNLPASSEIYITKLDRQFMHSTISFKKFTHSLKVPVFLQTEEETVRTLNISETDSIGMKVSRLSELSRQVVLYSTHIIRNQTYEDFSIEYEGRVYILERYFWLFITDSDIKNKKRKGRLNFYKNPFSHYDIVFENNAQVAKLQRRSEETKQEQDRKLVIDIPKRKRVRFVEEPVCDNACGNCTRKCASGCLQCLKSMFGCQQCSLRSCRKCWTGCAKKMGCERCCNACLCTEDSCDSSRGCFGQRGYCTTILSKCPDICKCSQCCGQLEIRMDTSIIIYEIVLRKHESTVNISQTTILFYRYEIVNETSEELILFHHNVEIMRLEPRIRRHVYYYKSNSEWFRIAKYTREEGKLLFSDLFRINEPRQFIVRVPKELYKQKDGTYPYELNYLYTVKVSQAEDLFFIRLTETNQSRFPIYFKNNTTYNARVVEGDQDFTLPPGEKIPFFFTNLDFKKGNEMLVQVEGVRKVVRMNQMSDMESFGLDQFYIGKKTQIRKSFKRGKLGVIFNQFHGDFNIVVDVLMQELRIYDEAWRVQQRVNLKEASIIDSEGSKIYIYLPDNDQLLLTIKHPSDSASWKQVLNDCLALRNNKRIFMTVDSDRTSRIIKLQETNTEDIKSIRKLDIEVFVKNLSVAMISGSPLEVILLDLKNIRYDRTRDIFRSFKDKRLSVTYEDVVVIGKFKISNQMQDTSNPVVAAQNRRGDFPCFEGKASKRFSVQNASIPNDPSMIVVDESLSTISHYTTLTLFLDEIEMVMDSQLVMVILELKREIERNMKVYESRKEEAIAVDILDINTVRNELRLNEGSAEVYINYLNIEPIKITMSVSWSQDIEQEVKGYGLGFLGRLPFGIESAVIQLNSFTSYHVYEKRNVLMNRVLKYYLEGAIFQVLNNAGSYDLLAPLRIINGVGEGARNIFYEPIYTLYKKKEMKATASKMFEGCVIFIMFLVKFLLKLIDVIFRLFSFFALDSAYTQRRNNFHKQTMKNPWYGFKRGGRFFLQMIAEFFKGFVDRPRAMRQRFGGGGIPLGILLAFLGIVKVIVGVFDFFWAVGSGFVNYAIYEPQAMDIRSRPIRIFKDGTIEFYNYNEALAHEVMRTHNIDRLRNEQVLYAKAIPSGSKHRYYIITNYRFMHCSENFSKQVIKYYSISKLVHEGVQLTIELAIPERTSYFFFTLKRRHYKFKFQSQAFAAEITQRLDKAIRSNSPLTEPQEQVLGSLQRLPNH